MSQDKHNQMFSPKLPDEGFVRLEKVLEVFPVSRSQWWRGVQQGIYPQGVRLGPNMRAWTVYEIRDLLQRVASQSVAKGNSHG